MTMSENSPVQLMWECDKLSHPPGQGPVSVICVINVKGLFAGRRHAGNHSQLTQVLVTKSGVHQKWQQK